MLRHVQKIFSSSDNNNGKRSSSSSSSNCCSTEQLDDNSALINVNQYAPIDKRVFEITRSEKELNRRKKKKSKAKTPQQPKLGLAKPICQVLRFEAFGRQDKKPIIATLNEEDSLDFEKLTISRYQSEFQELELIGQGKFGSVYRCVNRLDGREYAIKQSRPLLSSAFRQRRARNEVHANSVLLGHVNVVRYYSAWLENGCVHIQQEYCNAGDLGALVDRMKDEFKFFKEPEIKRIALHVAEGLKYMHSENLVHLDVKPENIFMMRRRRVKANNDGNQNNRNKRSSNNEDEIIYKIGDMGHVTLVNNAKELEDEGDSRYLSKELLRDDYADLPKADIFALGLTIYDVAGGGPLPENGPEWHRLREGNVRRILRYSEAFHVFLRQLIHLDPKKRPSAADLVQCEYVNKDTDVLADFPWLNI